MYLTIDSLTDINNIMTGSNNITLIKVNVEPSEYDKMYMVKDLIEDKLYQLIDQFHQRKINHKDFIQNCLTIYIHFIMKIEEIVRYYFTYG